MTTRKLYTVIFLTMFAAGMLLGQSTGKISSVQVSSEPSGAAFLVDGFSYNGPQTFLWPAGSKHTIQFLMATDPTGQTLGFQESSDGLTHWDFGGWSLSNGGILPKTGGVTIIADPAITFIKMIVTKSFRVQLRFSSFPVSAPGDCTPGVAQQDGVRSGVIVLSQTCYGSNADVFLPAGPVVAAAYPFAGFVFGGWSTNGSAPVSTLGTINITAPTTLVAQFVQAKRITFRTNPAGLNVLVDRSLTPTIDGVTAPAAQNTCPANLSLPGAASYSIPGLCYGDFDFFPGSSHVIGAPSPQYDRSGTMFVIDSFSNGLKPNDTLVVSKDLSRGELITANFIPGQQVSFLSNPVGLKLTIDGRSNWLSYNFAWGSGTTHTISAGDQPDGRGRRWMFRGWSGGGAAAQTITVTSPMRYIANFDALPQAILQTDPPGIVLKVDGVDCPTPCVLDRPAGSVANVVAPATLALTDQSRLEFTGWSDGGSNTRTVVFDADQRTLTAPYQTTFKVTASGDPTQGASFSFNPPSKDNFFAQNSGVTVTATAKNGYRFRRWDGDLGGTYNQGTLLMSAPHQVMALLDKVPFLSPAGIRNAAGVTPDGTVAPGSLISITGESLAQAMVQSASLPLSQGLGGVTVILNNRLLPLVYVSPQEIRAQVFSDLPDGDYALSVQSQGQPTVTGAFTVARNSPGLFPAPDQDLAALAGGLPVAWATHADGSAVTIDSPAVTGEVVTLNGTGFGPVDGFTFDGFASPASYKMKDSLQVMAGGVQLEPEWAGAVAGQVGMMTVRFRITPELPSSTVVAVSVMVNGKSSNAVNLALQ